jgi:flagellar motor switch/type III secretory pathway protein FliN
VPRSQLKNTPIPAKLPTPQPVVTGRPSGEIVVPQISAVSEQVPAVPGEQKYERLKAIPTFLKLELGTLSISPYDFMSLEINEVLLLRDLDLIFAKNQLKGKILLKLENDEEYYWIGWLQPEQPALYTIQIKEIFKNLATHSEVSGRLILANSNSLKNKANRTGANQALNADSEKRLATLEASLPGFSRTDLLKGMKLTVTLEMSQIKLKFADIMQLKPEQIIQIHHTLPPLVNLMVNKQMIAQGVLIEHPEGCALKLTKI